MEQKGQRGTVDAKDLCVQRIIDEVALERDAYVDLLATRTQKHNRTRRNHRKYTKNLGETLALGASGSY